MRESRWIRGWRLGVTFACLAGLGAGCNSILGNDVPTFGPAVDLDASDGPTTSPDATRADGATDALSEDARGDAADAGDAAPDAGTHVADGGEAGTVDGGKAGDGGDGGGSTRDGGGADGGGADGGEAGVVCPMGETNCSGTCVNLATDMNNCGTCGRSCPLGCAGQCVQLVVRGGSITASVALPLRGVIANVLDALTTDMPGALTSTIDWGDGTATTFGTLTGGSGAFALAGAHTYAAAGTNTVTVTVSDTATGATGSAMLAAMVRPTPALAGFNVLTANAFPSAIALAMDGNLWFVENGANQIGRITTAGTVNEFVIPTTVSSPGGIAATPDGKVWFTEQNSNKLGQITPSSILATGQIPEFDLGAASPMSPGGLVSDASGNLWLGFANTGIGLFVPGTQVFTVNPNGSPTVLCRGPDGNIWFTDVLGNAVGKVTPSGVVTEYPVTSSGSQPFGVAAGPDGNIWFTENVGNAIGRMTPAGVCTEFPLPTATSLPKSIVAGPDGNLWFLEPGAENVGRITTTGAITEIPIPVASQTPGIGSNGLESIAVGSDGNLWFTESDGERIGRLTP